MTLEIAKLADIHWTAVHTKPRCEKVLANYCERHGIACYLPLQRKIKRFQRRNVESSLPMFRGYVFAQLDEPSKSVLLQSHKVVCVLQMDDARESGLIDELQSLQRLETIESEAELIVQPELLPGAAVLIADGPLRGLRGIVQRRQQKTRVTVNVGILGQSVAVDLDVGEVETAEE